MKYTDDPIASADEVRALLSRVAQRFSDDHLRHHYDHLDKLDRKGEHEAAKLYSESHHIAIRSAIRYAIAQTSALMDHELLPLAVNAMWMSSNHIEFEGSDLYELCQELKRPLSAKPQLEPLKLLARMGNSSYREIPASHLDPTQDDQKALLQTLVNDASDRVRKLARANMATVETIHWWTGKFKRDPASHLDEEQLAALKPHIERIVTLFDDPQSSINTRNGRALLVKLAEPLPDPLLCDFFEVVLSDLQLVYISEHNYLELLVQRHQGVEVILRLLPAWLKCSESYQMGELLGKKLADADHDVHRALCRGFLTLIDARKKQTLNDDYLTVTMAGQCATALRHLWPAEDDPTPVLDLFERLPESQDDVMLPSAQRDIASVLTKVNPDVIPWQRLLEVRAAGWPGNWRLLHNPWREAMKKAPPEIFNPLSTAILIAREDKKELQWLLGCLLDPERTTTEDARWKVFRDMMDTPETREAFFTVERSARSPFIPALWEELTEGHLTLSEANRVMNDRLMGHPLAPLFNDVYVTGAMSEHPGFMPPITKITPDSPFTPEDWATWQRVREQYRDEPAFLNNAMTLLPHDTTAWTPSDHALIQSALDAALAHPDEKTTRRLLQAAVLIAHRDGREALDTINGLLSPLKQDQFVANIRKGIALMLGEDPNQYPITDDDD